MAIALKPNRRPPMSAKPDPLEFIAGAEKREQASVPQEPTKPQKRRKEPVIIRFDEKTLHQIDQAAEKRGLSRAALVRMLVIEHLPD
jgi:Ribbon-helix-helix protein, copG family